MESRGFTDLNHLCACTKQVLPVRKALSDVGEEIVELLRIPIDAAHEALESFGEETSDIAYAFGRLVGAVFGRPYFRIPGDSAALTKIRMRVLTTGCIRSLRHRADGECATAGRVRPRIRCESCGAISRPLTILYLQDSFEGPCPKCGDDHAIHHMEVVQEDDDAR